MNSQDLKNLIDYIMDNNSQKEASFITKGGKQYKYVNFSLDTRDGKIFEVKFINPKKEVETFGTESPYHLDSLYKWLDEEVTE